VPPDPVLRVEGAVLSEAPREIRSEHPTPKPVTDNLDNFSNRADRHRLSIPSTHKVGLLPLFLSLRRSSTKVIAVTEVIGYRSRPKKRATRVDSKVSDLRSSDLRFSSQC
jgi:hypothetical protein